MCRWKFPGLIFAKYKSINIIIVITIIIIIIIIIYNVLSAFVDAYKHRLIFLADVVCGTAFNLLLLRLHLYPCLTPQPKPAVYHHLLPS